MQTKKPMWAIAASIAVASVFTSAPVEAQSDLRTHLTATIDGQMIVGDVEASLGKGTIECEDFGFEVQRPSNLSSSRAASGSTVYSPITCTTSFDASTIHFWRALTLGSEVSAAFDFYRLDPSGRMAHAFAIEIGRARVTAVRVMADARVVQVQFEYADITMGHTSSGIEHADGMPGGK